MNFFSDNTKHYTLGLLILNTLAGELQETPSEPLRDFVRAQPVQSLARIIYDPTTATQRERLER